MPCSPDTRLATRMPVLEQESVIGRKNRGSTGGQRHHERGLYRPERKGALLFRGPNASLASDCRTGESLHSVLQPTQPALVALPADLADGDRELLADPTSASRT